jgi:SynChlorMet cassette protein ScmC
MAASENWKAYSITLADGKSCELAAWSAAIPWLDKLATIMRLEKKESTCQRKMIFIRDGRDMIGGNIESHIGQCTREMGWETQRIGPVCMRSKYDELFSICELGEGDWDGADVNRMVQILYPLYNQIQKLGGMPLHAALAERKGEGFAIAAPGGTGKSTCSRRLPQFWNSLCDDETLIVRNKDGLYNAHPFPTWSEHFRHKSSKSWKVQYHVPLKAIFILEQSEIDEVKPIGQGEAASFLYYSASQILMRSWVFLDFSEKSAAKKTAFENACQMAKSVPVYLLRASLTGRFWEHIEEVLDKS